MSKINEILIGEDILIKLTDFSRLITKSLPRTCIVEEFIDNILDIWQGDAGAIFVKDNENMLQPMAYNNLEENLLVFKRSFCADNFKLPLEGFSEEKSGEELYRILPLSLSSKYNMACVPLWLENNVIGIFGLYSKKRFDSGDFKLLELLVNQISCSLEKELAKEKIKNLNYCFKSIFNSLKEGIIVSSGEKLVYYNKKAEDLLELERNIRNYTFDEFFKYTLSFCKDPLKAEALFETSINLSTDYYSFEIETKKGNYYKITRLHVKDESGEMLGSAYVFDDISRYKEMEQIKDDIIAVVSHELRTPLTCIKGNVSSLLREDVEWDQEVRTEFLTDIHEECIRLNDFVQKLLDISKLNAAVMEINKEYISVEKLISKTKSLLSLKMPKQYNIKFEVSNGSDIVEADEQRIVQVLMNLIENAVKYGGENVNIEVRAASKGKFALFSVADDGPGISDHDIDNVFEKFYQVKKKDFLNKGAGLGLAISKGFIDLHGGTIWAGNIEGKGAVFKFTLPLKVHF